MSARVVMVSRLPVEDDDLIPVAMEVRYDSAVEEQDDVDDSESPAGLEHGTGLVGDEIIAAGSGEAKVAEFDCPRVARCDAGAVGISNGSKEVYSSNESAEDENVDEGDEVCVMGGAVVEEQGADGPDESEDGDDEEDENRVWGESVGVGVDVDEPSEHAHYGNL